MNTKTLIKPVRNHVNRFRVKQGYLVAGVVVLLSRAEAEALLTEDADATDPSPSFANSSTTPPPARDEHPAWFRGHGLVDKFPWQV